MLRAVPNLKEQDVQHAKKIVSGKLPKATGLFSQHCVARGEEAAFFQVSLLAEFQALLLQSLPACWSVTVSAGHLHCSPQVIVGYKCKTDA